VPDETSVTENDEPGDEHEFGRAVTSERPRPGDIIVNDPTLGQEPFVGQEESTPLETDEPEGGDIPAPVLWALKLHRHAQIIPHAHIREAFGTGDSAVYVIDDGHSHAALGRAVGVSPDGAEYVLAGRISLGDYERLREGRTNPVDAFNDAKELTLYGVDVEEGTLSSNLFEVSYYDSAADVPKEYLPPSKYRHFKEDLEITVD